MKKKKKQRLVVLAKGEENQSSVQQYESEVRPNDYKVLGVLNEKSEYTFRGIMRKINMHQETLSRSLYRLRQLGLVDKSDLGYKISSKMQNLPRDNKTHVYTPILMSYLPPTLDSDKIIAKVAGSWFKGLRWVRIIQDDSQQTLQWQSGQFYINLKIFPNYIIIETNADNEKDKVDAMSGAFRVIQKITGLYDPSIQLSDLTN